jgi:hypothetical protein
MGIPAGQRSSSYRSPYSLDAASDADDRQRLVKIFEEEREAERKKKPTQTQLMEKSVELAGARAVEALRYGMRYEEVLARIVLAMDEEICKVIHDE